MAMQYKIYKLCFLTAVHLGSGSLTDTGNQLLADTVFSALCQEAATDEGIEQLVHWVRAGELVLSDGLPFVGDVLYVPKPAVRVQAEQDGNSVLKKHFKKLKYIPLDRLAAYLQGQIDPEAENRRLQRLGAAEMRTLAAGRNKVEAEPFFVGTYRFHEGSGLYLIAGFAKAEIQRQFEQLLQSMTFSGIGGKRSAGLGKFKLDIDDFAADKLSVQACVEPFYMNLSVAMAEADELAAVLQGASYTLVKRSGFVASTTYAPENRRKRDFYAFQSGSCFQQPFVGGVFDVSGSGRHPVYRYAKPLFLEVK